MGDWVFTTYPDISVALQPNSESARAAEPADRKGHSAAGNRRFSMTSVDDVGKTILRNKLLGRWAVPAGSMYLGVAQEIAPTLRACVDQTSLIAGSGSPVSPSTTVDRPHQAVVALILSRGAGESPSPS